MRYRKPGRMFLEHLVSTNALWKSKHETYIKFYR